MATNPLISHNIPHDTLDGMNVLKARAIDGFMSKRELNWIAHMASKYKTIVEVGCYKGRSTRAWTDNTSGKVYAVDPWNGNYYRNDGKVLWSSQDLNRVYNEFLANVKDCGNLIVFRGSLPDFFDSLPVTPDLIFIDGDHRYENVKNDLLTAFQSLQIGGIIAGHDYSHSDWPGVKRAVDEFFPNVNLEESIWWTQKS